MASINKIVAPSKYEILREVIKDYPGLLSTIEPLFDALDNYAKDWGFIVKEMRSYALKNFYIHDHHEKGIETIRTIVSVFFEAINNSDTAVQQASIENLVFYLEKILIDGNNELHVYEPVFQDCFVRLNQLQEKPFFLLVTNPHQLKKIGQIIFDRMPSRFDIKLFNELLIRYFSTTYKYWLKENDPMQWLKRGMKYLLSEENVKTLDQLLYPVSHVHLKELALHLNSLRKYTDQYSLLRELLQMPGYMQLVKYYEDLAGMFAITGDAHKDFGLKMMYLLKLIEIEGLFSIHENIFKEINRTFSNIIKIEEPDEIKVVLSEIVNAFKNGFKIYPDTILYCIQIIGNEIYNKGNSSLVEWYLQKLILLGFHYPEIQGVTDEWQVKSNRAHLKNIRVWLELIGNSPKWSKSLISALIINLRLGGVHINDTDLFQKDLTKLLNSDIKPVYHLIKQLAKLLPVYFSEIGTEGALRDVSTEIDDSIHRADVLIHFLRKQSHVESSARVVDFIEEVFHFWKTKDKTPLKGFLPDDIYQRINTSGPYIDEMNIIFNAIFMNRGIHKVSDLLHLKENDILAITQNIPYVSDNEKKRAYLSIKFYQLLYRKYKFDPQDVMDQLRYAQSLGLPNIDSLIGILEHGSVYQRLEGILNYLQLLRDVILSPEKYEPVENIFRKRHIAAGIPSMYGKYNERKFDALSLTFRLENLVNVLFEELIHSFNLKFITRASLFQIQKYANLFFKALQLDGISSNRLENTLELLTVALDVRRFSFSQYIDIFRGFSEAVQDILNSYYSGMYKDNLKCIIPQLGIEHILSKYIQPKRLQSDYEFMNKISEQFLREVVSSSFGLQQLDNFISMILKTLFEQAEGLDVQNLDLLMSYDPKKALSTIHMPNKVTYDRIHLGNKGYNLIMMASLGIPVPPGFIITTEVFRCEKAINRFRYAGEHLDDRIKEEIIRLEKQTGKKFGDPDNPLIVSVRSGGAISMPGMMNSFLNVGINESIVKGLIKRSNKPWFAWDCYRRFLQCWGMSFGIERDTFDDIINSFKSKYRVLRKIQFTPKQMKEVAFAYLNAIKDNGIEIIEDPREQLNAVIDRVFQSWFSKKAHTYREILGISENWGTAVIVQSMVYGNLDRNSGTGVLFTRNPQVSGDKVVLWGDFAIGAQGEDIVSGLIKTLPISNVQRPLEERTSEISFEDCFPELYSALLKIIEDLIYKQGWGAQEIEFTFEGKNRENLYILQARDMAITERESFKAFKPSADLSSNYLSRGIGVGGSAMSGRVVFDLDEIKELREKDPDAPLILVRSDTVPDDIRHISAADGLLTARGGSTSHAAIIASRLGKTCVVGCHKLIVWEHEKRCKLNKRIVKVGDFLSIDGRNGYVYLGKHKVREIKAEIATKL